MNNILEALGLSEEDEYEFLMQQKNLLEQVTKNKKNNDEYVVDDNEQANKKSKLFDKNNNENQNQFKAVNKPVSSNDDKEIDYITIDDSDDEIDYEFNLNTNKSNTDNVIERPKKVNESSIVVKKEDEIVEYEGLDMCFVRIIDKIPDLNYALLANDTIPISLTDLPLNDIKNLLLHTDMDNLLTVFDFLKHNGLITLLLYLLSALTHIDHQNSNRYFYSKVLTELTFDDSIKIAGNEKAKHPNYSNAKCWNKGIGFSNGSKTQEWDPKILLEKKQNEERYSIEIIKLVSLFLSKCVFAMDAASFELIEDSCIFPLLTSNLRNDSIMDISRHLEFYKCLFELLEQILNIPEFELLVNEHKITVLISKMDELIKNYEKLKALDKKAKATEDDLIEELIPYISKITQIKALSHVSGTNKSSESKFEAKQHEEVYCSKIKDYQFDSYDLKSLFTNNVHFASSNQSRSKRLAQEIATLSTSLPLSYSSSVFLRCDSDHLDMMSVLITGPEDTPYQNGCFVFDISFPNDFPTSPPHVIFKTTGNGQMRFNPNLYNCGKVCLSILNTWEGRPEEKWNEATSSILQVLVSIQSLILVTEPYFNEPAHQSMGNKNASMIYNEGVKCGTVRWAMLDMIRNPPKCFKDVVQRHFYLKKEQIKQQCKQWIENKNNIKTKNSSPPQYSPIPPMVQVLPNLNQALASTKNTLLPAASTSASSSSAAPFTFAAASSSSAAPFTFAAASSSSAAPFTFAAASSSSPAPFTFAAASPSSLPSTCPKVINNIENIVDELLKELDNIKPIDLD